MFGEADEPAQNATANDVFLNSLKGGPSTRSTTCRTTVSDQHSTGHGHFSFAVLGSGVLAIGPSREASTKRLLFCNIIIIVTHWRMARTGGVPSSSRGSLSFRRRLHSTVVGVGTGVGVRILIYVGVAVILQKQSETTFEERATNAPRNSAGVTVILKQRVITRNARRCTFTTLWVSP